MIKKSTKKHKKAEKIPKKHHFCLFWLKKVQKSVFFDEKLFFYKI